MRKAIAVVTLAGIAGSVVLTQGNEASAQSANVRYVTPTAKGIVGCALLGAETVALIEAAAGVRARWAYIAFPLVGAAAGGVGGYFLESAAGSDGSDTTLTGVAVGSLVLGLGLVVPTLIAYTNATAYRPENDQPANEDAAPSNAPIDEATTPTTTAPPAEGGATTQPAGSTTGTPGGGAGGTSSPPGPGTGGTASRGVHPGGSGRRSAAAAPSLRATGLLDFGTGGMAVTVPAVSVENSVSLHDMRQYGLAPQTELRVPLLSGTF